MSNFDVPTGDPPSRRRYRIGYSSRPVGTEGPWEWKGTIEVVSRSPEEAKEFAESICNDGRYECQVDEPEDVTDGEV